jgi:alpha-tubulin suppressor-like RCC1 family protein
MGAGCGCISAIAGGLRHNCAIKVDGTVWCWGANDVHQLGIPGNGNEPLPVEVSGAFGPASPAVEIVAWRQTCARRADGTVLCWGDNSFGQADPADTETPIASVTLDFATTTALVSAGGQHTCLARDEQPFVTCWGANDRGQLTGAPGLAPGPIDMAEAVAFEQLTLGAVHGCARTVTGEVHCWGDNTNGQLAAPSDTTPSSNSLVPVSIPPAADIAAGRRHSCARAGEQVYCWGRNDQGQLGDGTGVQQEAPVLVSLPANLGIAELESGPDHTCVVTIAGAVYCWGSNADGQLMLEPDELGFDGYTLVPQQIELSDGAQSLSAGEAHTCVLTDSGEVLCWGRNAEGQAGNGSMHYVFAPTPVELSCP